MEININNANFVISAVSPRQYPDNELYDVAMVGRSNVGKSSLINSMLNRKNLARISSTPGRTREINFFNIDNKLNFVDLPGYGFAKVAKTKKDEWGKVVDAYLNSRKQLKLLISLVDIRHEPSKDDKAMQEWIIEAGISRIIVATKSDKISRSQVNIRVAAIKKDLNLEKEEIVLPYSSESKSGREELWNIIKNSIG
jgi:GTP-binding protein